MSTIETDSNGLPVKCRHHSKKHDDDSDDEYDEIGLNEDANWDSDDENHPKRRRHLRRRRASAAIDESAFSDEIDDVTEIENDIDPSPATQSLSIPSSTPLPSTSPPPISLTTTQLSSPQSTFHSSSSPSPLPEPVSSPLPENQHHLLTQTQVDSLPPSTQTGENLQTISTEPIKEELVTHSIQDVIKVEQVSIQEEAPLREEVSQRENVLKPDTSQPESEPQQEQVIMAEEVSKKEDVQKPDVSQPESEPQQKEVIITEEIKRDVIEHQPVADQPLSTQTDENTSEKTDTKTNIETNQNLIVCDQNLQEEEPKKIIETENKDRLNNTEIISPTVPIAITEPKETSNPNCEKKTEVAFTETKEKKKVKKKKAQDFFSSKRSTSLSPEALSTCVSEPFLPSTSLTNSPLASKTENVTSMKTERTSSPMRPKANFNRKKKEKRDSKFFSFLPPIMLKSGWVRQSDVHVNKNDFVSHRSSLYAPDVSRKYEKDNSGNVHEVPDIDLEQVDAKLIPTNQELLLPEDESVEPHIRNKNKVINELIITERDYIFDLLLMIKLFYQPLEKQKILKPLDLTNLFGNLALLLNVNKELLINLQKQIAQPLCPRIGSAFIQMSAYLKMYSVYCNNHQASLDLVVHFCKTNPAFNAFYQERLTDPHCRNLPLSAYLIKPVQRICKYPLFLKELQKHTKEEDADYPDLLEASKRLEATVTIINESKRLQENQNKILQIQNRLDAGKKLGLLKPSRRFYLEGLFEEVDRETQQVLDKGYYFLFNDMLVRALKQKPLWNPLKKKLDYELLKPTHVLEFFASDVELQFINHEDSPTLKNAFEIKGFFERILLGNSPLETQVWMQKIQECLRQKNSPSQSQPPISKTNFLGDDRPNGLATFSRLETTLSVPALPTETRPTIPLSNQGNFRPSFRPSSLEIDDTSLSPNEKKDKSNSTQDDLNGDQKKSENELKEATRITDDIEQPEEKVVQEKVPDEKVAKEKTIEKTAEEQTEEKEVQEIEEKTLGEKAVEDDKAIEEKGPDEKIIENKGFEENILEEKGAQEPQIQTDENSKTEE